MTTTKIVPDFPGAYGAKAGEWERQKRTEIALMPKREGYRPKMVLGPRPPATITATAVQVSDHERAQFGQQALNRRARVLGDVEEPERAAHVRPAGAQAARLLREVVGPVVAPRLGAALEGVGPERGAERPPQRPHVV